jgi:hypothetical protein
MSDMNRSFAGQMPEFYDRFLVPVMFAPFALDPRAASLAPCGLTRSYE